MDWLILFLLVSLVVVPVVLLYGFAGCFTKPPPPVANPLAVPGDLRVASKDVDRIGLEWNYPTPDPATFELEVRVEGASTTSVIQGITAPAHELPGLMEGAVYFFRVRAIRTSDQKESGWSDVLQAATLAYQIVFEAVLTNNGRSYEGDTLVQRIEPVPNAPAQAIPRVRLTLRAADDDDILLDRVTISRAAPGGDPYDAESDLAQVTTGLMIPTNNAVTLEVTYSLDPSAPLLIAFDVNPAGPASTRFVGGVSPTVATCYYGLDVAQAATLDRTAGYDDRPRVELVERIEVPAEIPLP